MAPFRLGRERARPPCLFFGPVLSSNIEQLFERLGVFRSVLAAIASRGRERKSVRPEKAGLPFGKELHQALQLACVVYPSRLLLIETCKALRDA